MTHDTFHALALDVLYEELEGPEAAALHAHAATCESCGAALERLRQARQRGRAVLAEPVPPSFEDRIMAAVDAALAARADGSPRTQPMGGLRLVTGGTGAAPAGAQPQAGTPLQAGTHASPQAQAGTQGQAGTQPQAGTPAKVIPFYSRPAFAAAASFLLIAGAAAVLTQMSGFKRSAPSASAPAAADEAAPVAAAAATATAVPGVDPAASMVVAAQDPPPPVATAAAPAAAPRPAAVAPMAAPADEASGALALNESASRKPSHAAPKVAHAPRAMTDDAEGLGGLSAPPAPAAPAKGAAASGATAGGGGAGGSFAEAKALYDAGRYSEALTRFDALKGSSADAALYAALCVKQLNGCNAAVARLDAVSTRYPGTSASTRARSESSACAAQAGPAATTSPGVPSNAKPASPKKKSDAE